MDKSFVPRVFISYAWSSEEYGQKVVDFATQLRNDGIDVILDKWDMTEGDYIYSFMERCVNDLSITNVLILMDPVYATKANKHVGGVGTETQIMTPKIYTEVYQDKYIPVLFQRDESNIVQIPTFLQGRLYFDLTTETNYIKMYRTLVKKLYRIADSKPPLGKRPSWVDENIESTQNDSREREKSKVKNTKSLWPFFRKKPSYQTTDKSEYDTLTNEKYTAKRKYTCLFCQKQFTENEILFGMTLNIPDPEYRDSVFNAHLTKFQHEPYTDDNGISYGLYPISRRFIDKDSNKTQVIVREDNGLPLIIEGPLQTNIQKYYTDDNSPYPNESDVYEADVYKSDERLCPYCHFTLPRGFANERVIRIGLLGGSGSGKTTYMAVVSEYLTSKMGILNSGLNLAQIELLPECQKYVEALYRRQRNLIGAAASPIVGEIKDRMIMPIIIHFKPIDMNYEPFFIILQDTPGEYLLPKNRRYLMDSNIPQSDHIIMFVDINQFIITEQQEYISEFGSYCKCDINDLFANMGILGTLFPPHQLQSIQCTLTKLDFWRKEEDSRLRETVFAQNCDMDHFEAIDVDRLNNVHDQLAKQLHNMNGIDQSGILKSLLTHMNIKNNEIHCAYTAVASRIVPGHEDQIRTMGADYMQSLNVLEPLMNIFDWEHVLPTKP